MGIRTLSTSRWVRLWVMAVLLGARVMVWPSASVYVVTAGMRVRNLMTVPSGLWSRSSRTTSGMGQLVAEPGRVVMRWRARGPSRKNARYAATAPSSPPSGERVLIVEGCSTKRPAATAANCALVTLSGCGIWCGDCIGERSAGGRTRTCSYFTTEDTESMERRTWEQLLYSVTTVFLVVNSDFW